MYNFGAGACRGSCCLEVCSGTATDTEARTQIENDCEGAPTTKLHTYNVGCKTVAPRSSNATSPPSAGCDCLRDARRRKSSAQHVNPVGGDVFDERPGEVHTYNQRNTGITVVPAPAVPPVADDHWRSLQIAIYRQGKRCGSKFLQCSRMPAPSGKYLADIVVSGFDSLQFASGRGLD